MIMASEETAALVRKAYRSIIDDPKSWNQGSWIRQDSECGTTFCLGGWMLVHAGVQVERTSSDWPYFTGIGGRLNAHEVWDVLRPYIEDIHGHWDPNGSVTDTIFSPEHDTIELLTKAIEDAGIDLTHVKPGPLDFVIRAFVTQSVAQGDRITESQVREDKLFMDALLNAYVLGKDAGLKAGDAGVLEAQTLLKRTQEALTHANSRIETLKSEIVEHVRLKNDVIIESRAFQDEHVDCDRSANPRDREIRKLRKALRERTSQASQAGTEARIAKRRVALMTEEMEGLKAQNATLRQMQAVRPAFTATHQSERDLILAREEIGRLQGQLLNLTEHQANLVSQTRQESTRQVADALSHALSKFL
jgi:hypothetical protein